MENQEWGVGTRKFNSAPVELAKASNFDHDSPFMIEDVQKERIDGSVRPFGTIQGIGSGPYEFVIPSQTDSYLLMNNLALYAKVKVTRPGGVNMQVNDDVAPINCLGTTMWEHVEVAVNDYTISPSSSSNAHYKSYLETLLSFDRSAIDTHMTSQLFALDTAGQYEANVRNGANMGYRERQGACARSIPFDMMSPITHDFFRANNHLAPGNKLSIRMYKAKNSFLLNSGDNREYALEIMDLRLHYQRIRLKEMVLPPKIERYLITKSELKRFPIPAGLMSHDIVLHNGGKMPKSVIMAMVTTHASEGNYHSNPLNFQHFGVNKINLRVNGKSVPSEPLTPNFEENLITREFVHLFMNTGCFRMDRANCVTRTQFTGGMAIFPFDLNPDLCNGFHLHSSDTGIVSLELGFSEALEEAITIFVHSTYDELLSRKKGEADFTSEII